MTKGRYFNGRLVCAGLAVLFCCAAVLGLPLLGKGGTGRGRLESLLCAVPGGVFLMGSREAGAACLPSRVEVQPFRIGRHEVAVAEYAAYLSATGAAPPPGGQFIEHKGRQIPARGMGRLPVACVSRDDAEKYCRWLSAESGIAVRLPTEAEWEYAARGGIHGARYPWGWGDPGRRARFAADGPSRVGRYAPNAFGLYDMAGNMFEWCADDREGGTAVVRGGSWAEKDPAMLRVYRCVEVAKGYRDRDVGFRIAADEGGF